MGPAARPSHALRQSPPGREDAAMVLDDSVLRRADSLRELMHFSRAIVEDGEVSETEANGLRAWIQANPEVASLPQVHRIVEILWNYFADGTLTPSERDHLKEILEDFGG